MYKHASQRFIIAGYTGKYMYWEEIFSVWQSLLLQKYRYILLGFIGFYQILSAGYTGWYAEEKTFQVYHDRFTLFLFLSCERLISDLFSGIVPGFFPDEAALVWGPPLPLLVSDTVLGLILGVTICQKKTHINHTLKYLIKRKTLPWGSIQYSI